MTQHVMLQTGVSQRQAASVHCELSYRWPVTTLVKHSLVQCINTNLIIRMYYCFLVVRACSPFSLLLSSLPTSRSRFLPSSPTQLHPFSISSFFLTVSLFPPLSASIPLIPIFPPPVSCLSFLPPLVPTHSPPPDSL